MEQLRRKQEHEINITVSSTSCNKKSRTNDKVIRNRSSNNDCSSISSSTFSVSNEDNIKLTTAALQRLELKWHTVNQYLIILFYPHEWYSLSATVAVIKSIRKYTT